MPQITSGGGATLFDPVIEYANRHADADAVVYFTDGFGPVPKLPCRKPLLWVISKEGLAENSKEWDLLFGRKIKMLATG
jgi:predicted metal-dependent peptidase